MEIKEKNIQLALQKKLCEFRQIMKCLRKFERKSEDLVEELKILLRNADDNDAMFELRRQEMYDAQAKQKKVARQYNLLVGKLEEAEERHNCLCNTEKRLFKRKKNLITGIEEIEARMYQNKMMDLYCAECDQAIRGGTCLRRGSNKSLDDDGELAFC